MLKNISVRDKVHHNTRDNTHAQAYRSQYFVRHMVALRSMIADLDMDEQLRDLDTERDWLALNSVGVHLRIAPIIQDHRTRERFGDAAWTSTSPGYHMVPERVIEWEWHLLQGSVKRAEVDDTRWRTMKAEHEQRERGREQRKQEQRIQFIASRQRTLTADERRAAIRSEEIARYGFSRV